MLPLDHFLQDHFINMTKIKRVCSFRTIVGTLLLLGAVVYAAAQTDCADSSTPVNKADPTGMTVDQLIQRFTAAETRAKEARSHYAYTQDLLVQTLSDKAVNGQFDEITSVSYDDKGKRVD